jgi:polyisoprenoid-binding protein YceI
MKRRVLMLVIATGLIILVASFGYAAYFASSANPPHTPPGTPHTPPGTAVPCGTSIPSTGLRTFDIVPTQTTASYQVHENLVLRNLPDNVVTGTTQAVQGEFRIRSGGSPLITDMKIKVDLRTLKTDEERRDHYVRQNYLESDTFPYAEFTSTCAQGLPTNYHEGQMIKFQTPGNLTLHGKTNKVVFDVQGKVAADTITGTASTTTYMTDFGIQPPNLANIAISEDKVLTTIRFTAKER